MVAELVVLLCFEMVPNEARVSPVRSPDAESAGVEEDLSELEKFERYITSSVAVQRFVALKDLLDLYKSVGFDCFKERVWPKMVDVAADPESTIRMTLANAIPGILTWLNGPLEESGYGFIMKEIVPLLISAVGDSVVDVSNAAIKAICEAGKAIKKKHLKIALLNPLMDGIKSQEDDDRCNRLIYCMIELTPIIGPELTEEMVVEEFVALCESSSFRVRKTCAIYSGTLCKVLGQDKTISLIMPSFLKLSKDSIWTVRKGVTESVVDIASIVTEEINRAEIIPIIIRYVKDSSRWVRNSTYKLLGPLIYCLDSKLITSELLDLYKRIPTLSSMFVDSDISFDCAFSFPAVVSRLGPERWPELVEVHQTLCKNNKFKVRRTLSYSLHEIAAIIGTEFTETDLFPTFELFLKDLDDVRAGVITSIAKFLKILRPASRLKHIDTIRDIQRESDQNWRFRRLLASQLGSLPELYPVEVVAVELIPTLLALVRDRISSVRRVAVQQVGPFINALYENEFYAEFLLELQQLATSATFGERLLYIRIFEHLATSVSDEVLYKDYLPLFCYLAKDKVSNVRIALARSMVHLSQHSVLRDSDRIKAAILILSNDPVKEVSGSFSMMMDYLEKCRQDLSPESAENAIIADVEVKPYILISNTGKDTESKVIDEV